MRIAKYSLSVFLIILTSCALPVINPHIVGGDGLVSKDKTVSFDEAKDKYMCFKNEEILEYVRVCREYSLQGL